MLERFYTDAHAGDWPVRLGLSWWPVTVQPRAARRVLGRHLPKEITSRTKSVPFAAVRHFVTGVGCEPGLRKRVLRDGFGEANALYTLSNGDIEVVRAARHAGLFVVHEQILNPDVGRILREERERFPGIERQNSLEKVIADEQCDIDQWREAQLLLAPSEFVRASMVRMGADQGKIAVVEYGLSEEWLRTVTDPIAGRVLFVGSVGLRKGNHYLAQAKRILDRRHVEAEIRIIGPADPSILRCREFQGPTYCGQVPRPLMSEEYRRADVFVLPSLSEGCALVHLEALACGIPTITTPNCGSVVRDCVDGFIVPIRDPEALAEKIQTVVENRELRERMSRQARERAREFTWARYGERLLHAVSAAATTTTACP